MNVSILFNSCNDDNISGGKQDYYILQLKGLEQDLDKSHFYSFEKKPIKVFNVFLCFSTELQLYVVPNLLRTTQR